MTPRTEVVLEEKISYLFYNEKKYVSFRISILLYVT
jgi:hypothetical protein